MMKYFVPKNRSPLIRIRLDGNGTAVWNLIDGCRTVKEISDALAEHFNHEPNYEYRVAEFVRQLLRQGFVKIN